MMFYSLPDATLYVKLEPIRTEKVVHCCLIPQREIRHATMISQCLLYIYFYIRTKYTLCNIEKRTPNSPYLVNRNCE